MVYWRPMLCGSLLCLGLLAGRGGDAQPPASAETLAQQGLLEARQAHYEAAISYYTQAMALKPELPGLQMNLGLAYFKAAKFPEAIKTFKAVVKQHPDDPSAVRMPVLLGMAHYGMGDYLVAVPYLQQAAARDPQNLPLRLTLAHSCLWSKQYDCVLAAYKEILALNAESAEADMLAGEALDETGDAAGAMEQFRAAIKANPKEPNAHFTLGYLLWKQSQFAEAALEFQAELDNDAGQASARAYLADCYTQAGEYGKAEAELDKAVAADPGSAMAHRDLGIVYAGAGRNEEAIAELRRAIALDPADVAPHWRLAKLFQAAGRKDEASVEFAAASQMNRKANQALTDRISGRAGP